ncbi:hypothetical protein HYE28_01970 [Mycoplasmopsis bovis]|nr:hypothetical protein [Mycoplasmopsis bovis]QQH23018.1 hypothetical protein HYE28_01970 [Mycoplasmopsis bovis]
MKRENKRESKTAEKCRPSIQSTQTDHWEGVSKGTNEHYFANNAKLGMLSITYAGFTT